MSYRGALPSLADNMSTPEAIDFSVVYSFSGFFQPVDNSPNFLDADRPRDFDERLLRGDREAVLTRPQRVAVIARA